MKKLYIHVSHISTYYVNHKGEGWEIDKTKSIFYKCIVRKNNSKRYYIFMNLYPTHA